MMTVNLLVKRVHELRRRFSDGRRVIIAVAGGPGSGKSTICRQVVGCLQDQGIEDIAIVPMDGFHHTKATLATFTDPEEAFRVRGAPSTFDAVAFLRAVEALAASGTRQGLETAGDINLPSFDHAVQDPVIDAIKITPQAKVLLIEGNYTLFDQPPWNTVPSYAHEKWFVNVDLDIAKDRLIERHLLSGTEQTRAGAEARAAGSDLVNRELILQHLIEPDVVITNNG